MKIDGKRFVYTVETNGSPTDPKLFASVVSAVSGTVIRDTIHSDVYFDLDEIEARFGWNMDSEWYIEPTDRLVTWSENLRDMAIAYPEAPMSTFSN